MYNIFFGRIIHHIYRKRKRHWQISRKQTLPLDKQCLTLMLLMGYLAMTHAQVCVQGVNPLCCRWEILPILNNAKKLNHDWNTGTWVLIRDYSVRAIQWWLPTGQDFDSFQKSLHPCAFNESSLSNWHGWYCSWDEPSCLYASCIEWQMDMWTLMIYNNNVENKCIYLPIS